MRQRLLAGALVMFGALLAGCAANGAYMVRYGPPAPRYGIVGYAPGPGYVWTEGYWDLRGSNWAWAPGRWVRPPRAGVRWVSPEWRREGRGYRYHRGYWR